MAKHDSSDSEPEKPAEHSSSEEPETESPNNAQNSGISEYEEQRLARIAENRARMDALGLNKIASSLMGSAQKVSKHKAKWKTVKDADEDYRPNDDDDEDDEDFVGSASSGSRQRKLKNKGSKSKAKVLVQNPLSSSDYIDGDDELQQAIALSLKESAEVLRTECTEPSKCSGRHAKDDTLNEIKGNPHVQEDTGKRKKRKMSFTRRVQMTEDELVVHFCQLDEAGKGCITVRDLQKMAAAHDFQWTDKEIKDMIYCFDSNGDGKLSFDDFQKIVGRCNMIQGSENS